MTLEDEILFESRFPAENMTNEERNFCLALISQIREVNNPDLIILGKKAQFEIVTMALLKKANNVYFNGALYSDIETRWIDGTITQIENGFLIKTTIQRLNEYIEEEDKLFKTSDLISGPKRSTDYQNFENFEEEIPEINDEFVNNHTNMLLRKLK